MKRIEGEKEKEVKRNNEKCWNKSFKKNKGTF